MPAGIIYRMISDYEAQGDSCMQCNKDDTIYVQKPFVFNFQGTDEHPTEWLYGHNLVTDQDGYIPSEYVEFVKHISTRTLDDLRNPGVRVRGGASVSQQPNLPPVQEDPIPHHHHHQVDDNQQPKFPNYVPVTLGGGHFQNFSQPSDAELLDDQPWYWGAVGKDDVNSALKVECDGTFLVRDSQPAGCYTLTLRKDGGNKLIKIHQSGGKFGFSAPYSFDSVSSLIEYYRVESLAVYNTDLDITLRYPLPRPMITAQRKQQILDDLQKGENQLHQLTEQYERSWQQYDDKEKELRTYKTNMDSYKTALKMLEASKPILESNREKLGDGPEDQRIITIQRKKQTRITEITAGTEQVERNYHHAARQYREIEAQLNVLKDSILRIKKVKEAKIDWLRAQNVSKWEIGAVLLHGDEREDARDMYDNPDDLRRDFPNHCVQETWYFPNFTRDQAIRQLNGRQNGTFLIRDREAAGPPHACSLVANGEVHHCLIQKTKDGYGFAEPFNLHSTLKDLVLHYARNVLTPHNEMLTTTLAIPVKAR